MDILKLLEPFLLPDSVGTKPKLTVLQRWVLSQVYQHLADKNNPALNHNLYVDEMVDTPNLDSKSYNNILKEIKELRYNELIINNLGENTEGVVLGFFSKIILPNKAQINPFFDFYIDEILKKILIKIDFEKSLLHNNFPSFHSALKQPTFILLYDFLKENLTQKQLTIDIIKLKNQVGLEDKYKAYGSFKQKILIPAQEIIGAHTDIRFRFKEIKGSKNIDTLIFNIEPNLILNQNDNTLIIKELDAEKESIESQSPQFLRLKPMADRLGITPSVLSHLIESLPFEQVKNGLLYTQQAFEKKGIKSSIDGYFVKAVKQKYTNLHVEKVKKEAIDKEKKQQEKTALKEAESALKALLDAYNNRINTVVRELTAHTPSILTDATKQVIAEYRYYFTLKDIDPSLLTIEDFRRDPILRNLVIAEIQKQHFTHFREIDESFLPQIKALENQINHMKFGGNLKK